MNAEEFLGWFEDNPEWPAPDPDMIREMESEGIVFDIRDGAPFIDVENWSPSWLK